MSKREAKLFSDEQIDEWLKSGHQPDDVKSLLQQITKAVLERALQGKLTEHLGYAKGEITAKTSGNARNGSTSKSRKGTSARSSWPRHAIGRARSSRG